MRTILVLVLGCSLNSLAVATEDTVIPNGGAGAGSLSVINTATGMAQRTLATAATSNGVIVNSSFAITNTGSAAVLGFLELNPASSSVYVLSAVNLQTGSIIGPRKLSYVPVRGPVMVAANPKAKVIYLGYLDSSADFHIQAIDPATLKVILETNLRANGGLYMTVSPDGKTIYLSGSSAVVAVSASSLNLIGTVALAQSSSAVVSPDSSTLYVAAGEYPNMALSAISTATLKVTQTVSMAVVSVVFGLGISPDGSQIYLSGQANFQGTDIFTLNPATQTLLAVPAVVNGNVAVSPGGTVYAGNGSGAVVFDPASQSVTGTLAALSNGSLALNSSGSQLYFLNESSSVLAETGPPPEQTVLDKAATGFLSSVAYDAKNNLVLVADNANNVEVLDAGTLEPAGNLFIPNSSYAYLASGGGSGFVVMGGLAEVLRFDPASLRVTGSVTFPNPDDLLITTSQPAINGTTLYAPFGASQNGGPNRPAGMESVPTGGIAVVDTLDLKFVALWPFESLPLLGLSPGSSVGYAVLVGAQGALYLDEIDLSTGKVTVQAPVGGQSAPSPYSNPAVSPDGSTVYVSANGTLYAFNGKTLAITNAMSGIGLVNLTVSPDGNYLYGGSAVPCESCATPYSLQIVSTSSLQVVGTIPSAQQPGPALFVGN